MEDYDFSGWVTRNDLRCTDGRTIRQDAFAENDGKVVPLVWNHNHDDPDNVLGKCFLENRKDGVYGYALFNDNPRGKRAKELVRHGDITDLSIYANELKQYGGDVLNGNIREVSLVLAGANPGAYIENVLTHSADGAEPTEAILYGGFGIELRHSAEEPENKSSKGEKTGEKATGQRTVKDIIDTMNDEQLNVMTFLIKAAQGQKKKKKK